MACRAQGPQEEDSGARRLPASGAGVRISQVLLRELGRQWLAKPKEWHEAALHGFPSAVRDILGTVSVASLPSAPANDFSGTAALTAALTHAVDLLVRVKVDFSPVVLHPSGGDPQVCCEAPVLPPGSRRQLPRNGRRLPSNRWLLSSTRRLPSNRRRLPPNRRRLPPNRRRLPPNRRRLPPNHRRLTSSCLARAQKGCSRSPAFRWDRSRLALGVAAPTPPPPPPPAAAPPTASGDATIHPLKHQHSALAPQPRSRRTHPQSVSCVCAEDGPLGPQGSCSAVAFQSTAAGPPPTAVRCPPTRVRHPAAAPLFQV